MEQLFKKQQAEELAAKQAEKERVERERVETLKQKEVQRITEERRRTDKSNDNIVNGDHTQAPKFSTAKVLAAPAEHPAEDTLGNVQKSHSIVNIFGDRLRRGSDPNNVKRAESMKIGPKTAKRTPSFTTRRRAQSFRKNQTVEPLDLPPVEIQGILERKHELQSGGKKAPVRSWRPFHVVLCGQLLCFFKDEEDFIHQKAATAPVNILNARCEKAEDYTKKKNVFRLHLPDGSEFLFLTGSPDSLVDWVNKISFHAALPPNLQLMSYDESKKKSSPDGKMTLPTDEISPISSRTSSPDSQRRSSRHDSIGSSMSGGSYSTPQINFLQKQKELREQQMMQQQQLQQQSAAPQNPRSPQSSSTTIYSPDKPPIPPRGVPPPVPQRQSSNENINVTLRSQSVVGMYSSKSINYLLIS